MAKMYLSVYLQRKDDLVAYALIRSTPYDRVSMVIGSTNTVCFNSWNLSPHTQKIDTNFGRLAHKKYVLCRLTVLLDILFSQGIFLFAELLYDRYYFA